MSLYIIGLQIKVPVDNMVGLAEMLSSRSMTSPHAPALWFPGEILYQRPRIPHRLLTHPRRVPVSLARVQASNLDPHLTQVSKLHGVTKSHDAAKYKVALHFGACVDGP